MSAKPVASVSEGVATPSMPKSLLLVFGGLVVLLGAVTPLWTQNMPFMLVLASHALIAALVAVSLDLLIGNTGLLTFGHAGWYGFGSYVAGLSAKLLTTEMLVILSIAVLATVLLALAVGNILVRQIGKAFAILTLAFSQVLYAVVFIMSDFTGGEDGLQGIPVPTLLGIKIASAEIWYWLLYGTLVVMLCLAFWVRRSPLGKAWLGVRENTERAQFIGLNVFRLKLLAYVASASLAALAGGLFVLFNGATSPQTLHWFESGKMLMYVVLGGVGTIVGPAVGAIVFTFGEHYVSSYTGAWLIYFGALFVVTVIVAPGGIFGLLHSAWTWLAGRFRLRAG